MPLYIKDDITAELVSRLARLKGLSKQGAVRMAVEAELSGSASQIPIRDRLRNLLAENPLPPRKGKPTGKAIFDGLSGEL